MTTVTRGGELLFRSGPSRKRRAASQSAVVLSLAVAVAVAGAACGGDAGGGGGGGGGGGRAEFRRPVTLVVPFGPGVGADQTARLASPILEQAIGQQVPVINVPGASGNTGMTKLLQSRPNETIAVPAADTFATVAGGTASFDPDEIQPICRVSSAPSYLWVNTKGEYDSWDDVAKAAKAKPGKIAVSTVGKGGVDDIMLGALAQKGFKFRAVPFAEGGERKGAVLSGDTALIYEQAGDVKENVEAGQFKPVLLFGSEKVEGVEGDFVLSSELGITDVIDQWRGLVAQADMEDALVQKLSDACAKIPDDPKYEEFRESNHEFEGAYMPQAEFATFVKDEIEKMKRLGADYGVFAE